MKKFKYILISLIAITALVSCNSHESKRATTPNSCDTFGNCGGSGGGGGTDFFDNGNTFSSNRINVTERDIYNSFLRSVRNFCDIPQGVRGNNDAESLILSLLYSAAERCSKWDSIGYLEVKLGSNDQASIYYSVGSDFWASFLTEDDDEDPERILLNNTRTGLFLINNNTSWYTDFDGRSHRGLSMQFDGDLSSNRFKVTLLYNQRSFANFEVSRFYN